jgi:predicted nucleotide-binding protein
MTNLEDFGLIKLISGKNYIMINNIETVDLPLVSEEEKVLPNEEPPEVQSTAIEKTPEKQKQVFVAHGKNKKPLEQLEKILSKFKVKYKVAIDEPNSGRPIGEKVAELMKQCTSGIFIFTADEESRDADGNTVYRPSDNVVFELGAGTMLYGRKIVIFREESTKFGSDFTAFGHITFEKDKLDAKGTELLQELVEQGFLTINVP